MFVSVNTPVVVVVGGGGGGGLGLYFRKSGEGELNFSYLFI